MSTQTSAVLYIVPTPIGNLDDITTRSLQVLSDVDLIACEDTRHSHRLLDHYSIKTALTALHEHNERGKADWLVQQLSEGKNIALISDAGTPLISDPGYHLVNRVREAGFRVVPLPGACAAITALSASGLPTDDFRFIGFLPAKSGQRKKVLQNLSSETSTLIFYESPHRILDSLTDVLDVLSDREAVLARELTKTFETFVTGAVSELIGALEEDTNQQRGEMVLMVKGIDKQAVTTELADLDTMIMASLKYLGVKQTSALLSELTGVRKKEIYQRALEIAE
ncbi:16S rRNA (cytidine(1402)-2'-O)-methyltransferase [Litoribrevibacter albus]|uniref:Ribosomal RNA small subunit methyltransferase I n=1 Tax=Litoribrevibacter albus TaxID=1473156 RepID=A0AA37SDZ2_9GAMM|nr:16S rRNA (cytidine(1402)-2'-O)-methyltransferase [Litoribrevibacter albus]GLQ33245.1 ribosomal RNA small subunit methyltransferase I [Litoribrevibacter albus]